MVKEKAALLYLQHIEANMVINTRIIWLMIKD